ncbi:MAG: spore maturation protein [Eubacteriales bacterium]|nr:spore maturation protein [Eubacteriales bacterium]
MNTIWIILLAASAVCAIVFGKGEALGGAALAGAARAVETVLGLCAAFALWSGVLKAAQACGVQRLLSRPLAPLLKKLFPTAFADEEARQAITANLAANMLGLGNAATPAGIAAIARMKTLENSAGTATDEMCMFLVLNMSSVQLFPATVVALRAAAGSASPADIALPALLATVVTTIFGITATWVLARVRRHG